MPFPSYLSNFCTPSHHNAHRRVLADEPVDFSADQSAEEIAVKAASLFLPTKAHDHSLVGNQDAPVRLTFLGNAHAGDDLQAEFGRISKGEGAHRNLNGDAEKGQAVLKAIADAIFPALNTGNIARTEMARAAAMEIAVAIANPRNLTIGMRSVREAVNGADNAVGCKLGRPSKWGIDIHAYKNRITLCESNAWSTYHLIPPDDTESKAAGKRRAGDGTKASLPVPRNVSWQDGDILIADVCTTFTAKTGEWWLTRKLLPHRTQRATVGAKIEMLHVQSPDRTLHRALGYENGTKRHALSNWLACLCRFLRGVGISKVGKTEFEQGVRRWRAHRTGDAIPLEGDPDAAQTLVSQCRVQKIKRGKLVDEDARRIGRRSGTWSDSARYHGKVDLRVDFEPDGPGEQPRQNVDWGPGEAKRLPAFTAFPRTDPPKGSGGFVRGNAASSRSTPRLKPSAPDYVPIE